MPMGCSPHRRFCGLLRNWFEIRLPALSTLMTLAEEPYAEHKAEIAVVLTDTQSSFVQNRPHRLEQGSRRIGFRQEVL